GGEVVTASRHGAGARGGGRLRGAAEGAVLEHLDRDLGVDLGQAAGDEEVGPHARAAERGVAQPEGGPPLGVDQGDRAARGERALLAPLKAKPRRSPSVTLGWTSRS